MNIRNYKLKKQIYLCVTILLVALMLVTAFTVGLSHNAPYASASSNNRNTLSLLEISNDFSTLVVRSTSHKTLIFVERIYFNYNQLGGRRLALTDDNDPDCFVIVDITNEAGEWARVWGRVREERKPVPNDPAERIETLIFIELGDYGLYWEFRTFTNQERWAVSVNDGRNTLNFTFDTRDRTDGVIYHIDGVFGLPERHYPQVTYRWEFTSNNPEKAEIREHFREQALEAAESAPDGEPIRLEPLNLETRGINSNSFTQTHINASSMSMTADPNEPIGIEPAFVVTGAVILKAIVVTAVVVIAVCSVINVVQNIGNNRPPDLVPDPPLDYNPNNPDHRHEEQPTAPDQNQIDDFNRQVEENPLTQEQREQLERRMEFSKDNDAPTGSRIVRLQLITPSGNQVDVYDENGNQIYVNRATGAVGNANFALISRETNLLLRHNVRDRSIRDTIGNRFAVNVDGKLVCMQGIQPFSPRSQDDMQRKLEAMNVNTSAIDISRFMYRMDDENALQRAMLFRNLDARVGFWQTIGNSLSNLFGGTSSSRSGLQIFYDVLVFLSIIATVVISFLLALYIYKKVRQARGKT